MSFADKQLTCRDCGNSFLFTGGEQEFYANKGLQNEPVRCPPCRSSRKSTRLNEPEDGYVKYGVFASFGGRTPRQMHPATCADCGMMTEVPFQPRGDRPVYCSACYSKIKGAQEAEAEAAETATISAKSSDAPHVDLTPEERKLAETLLGTPAAADDSEASAGDSDDASEEPNDAVAEEAAEEPAEAPAALAVDEEDGGAPAEAEAAETAAVGAKSSDGPHVDLTPEERKLAETLLGTPAAADDGEASAEASDDADESQAEAAAPAATADDTDADTEEADVEPVDAEAPAAAADDDDEAGEATEEEAKPEPAEAVSE